MAFSRRQFLRAGTLVAISAALPISIFGQNPKDRDGNPTDQLSGPDPLANYNRAAFSSYLNSIFQIYTGYSVIEVALVEVKDQLPAGSTATNGRECFSLLFRGGSVALRQNTYAVKHPSLGSFQLFLVPGGPDDNGAQSYVAIINKLGLDQSQLATPPSRTSKTKDRMTPESLTTIPATAPATAPTASPSTSPTTTSPVETNTPPQKPKSRKRKPSWKANEDFLSELIDQ